MICDKDSDIKSFKAFVLFLGGLAVCISERPVAQYQDEMRVCIKIQILNLVHFPTYS